MIMNDCLCSKLYARIVLCIAKKKYVTYHFCSCRIFTTSAVKNEMSQLSSDERLVHCICLSSEQVRVGLQIIPLFNFLKCRPTLVSICSTLTLLTSVCGIL